MFKISASAKYAWPVKVALTDEKGRTQNQTFTAHFARLPQSELDEIMRQTQAGELGDAELAARVLVGWDGVQDEDGNEIEFDDVARDQVLDCFPVRPSVISAWFESLQGAKRKN